VSADSVQEVFIEILGLEEPIDWANVKYQETERWDSLGHMAIVAELEDRFDVMLETDDILNMSSYERALEILAKHGTSVS